MIIVYTRRGSDEWPDASHRRIDGDGYLTVTTTSIEGVTVNAVYEPGAWLDVTDERVLPT